MPQAQITFRFAGGPRGALRYAARRAPRAALTPSSCRLHPGASPPTPLVCPAGAPPGISGIRVRAARARCHAPRPVFKSLTVDGPVAYPTVIHKLYTPCPNGRRDVAKRLSHAGLGLVPCGGALGGPAAASGATHGHTPSPKGAVRAFTWIVTPTSPRTGAPSEATTPRSYKPMPSPTSSSAPIGEDR